MIPFIERVMSMLVDAKLLVKGFSSWSNLKEDDFFAFLGGVPSSHLIELPHQEKSSPTTAPLITYAMQEDVSRGFVGCIYKMKLDKTKINLVSSIKI